MMTDAKEEPSCSSEQAIDLILAVKELQGLSSEELDKLLKDSESCTVFYSSIKIDMEKLVEVLPLHLIAVLISSDKDEALLRYLLCGIRLLHSLCDLAPRQAKIEQILLDDVKVSEQLLDLVFYLLNVLSVYKQECHNTNIAMFKQSTLVACCLYLLTGFISSQWQDLVLVLLAHPKVDFFMDVAFRAVHVSIRFLQMKLSAGQTDICTKSGLTAEQLVNYLCQNSEASLQFLLSLCQQKMFRERLLRNKELCKIGGVLLLARTILMLNVTPPFAESFTVVATLSRLKSKVLSILLYLCEAESISYLDEVASSPKGLDLAQSVVLKVLELLKPELSRPPKRLNVPSDRTYPTGLLQLNAMRLADIFSDDSNFRSYITECFTDVLTAIFLLPHGEFLSSWCSSEHPVREEDATLEYDIFTAAGWILPTTSFSDLPNKINLEFSLAPSNMPQASYAHQRTSLFVKVIANLHCFIPNICEEQERNLFLNKFLKFLQADTSKSLTDVQKATNVGKNLRSLLSHAESLIPNFLNEEDLQLLRVFSTQLQSLITSSGFGEDSVRESKFEESLSCDKFSRLNLSEYHQEAQSTGLCSSPLLRNESMSLNNMTGNLKEEGMSENCTFHEMDQFNARIKDINQGNDLLREEKCTLDRNNYGCLREIDGNPQNVETSGSDTSSTRGKNSLDQMDNDKFPKLSEHPKGSGGVQEDNKVEIIIQSEEKQRRKRKRTIMNDTQMTVIERALLDEPDMQRNAVSIQSWADKLSLHGSEVTSSQLKNWLNNRKARLARQGNNVRAPSSEMKIALPEKQYGTRGTAFCDSPGSPAEEMCAPSNARDNQRKMRTGTTENGVTAPSEFVQHKPGQYVVLINAEGEEIGEGTVYQMHGNWHGRNLEESSMCVIDINQLKAERWVRLPYPSEETGTSFDEAESKIGMMRVLWDLSKISMFPRY